MLDPAFGIKLHLLRATGYPHAGSHLNADSTALSGSLAHPHT
jgi:hypothetical protein